MAAGALSAPGTEYGPCETECRHTDCAASRREAAEVCDECHEPIGYERRFFIENPWPAGASVPSKRYVHESCAYVRDERDRKAAP